MVFFNTVERTSNTHYEASGRDEMVPRSGREGREPLGTLKDCWEESGRDEMVPRSGREGLLFLHLRCCLSLTSHQLIANQSKRHQTARPPVCLGASWLAFLPNFGLPSLARENRFSTADLKRKQAGLLWFASKNASKVEVGVDVTIYRQGVTLGLVSKDLSAL